MPRVSESQTIGNVTVISCGRTPHVDCSTPGCSRHAGERCCYPVKRKGEVVTCDRAVCESCAMWVGGGLRCGPHARMQEGSGR